MATIIEAARALNAQCDGAQSRDKVGFNGSDAPFAKSLLGQAYLTTKQLTALHRLLQKYGGQLARLGFAYSELVVPPPGLQFVQGFLVGHVVAGRGLADLQFPREHPARDSATLVRRHSSNADRPSTALDLERRPIRPAFPGRNDPPPETT